MDVLRELIPHPARKMIYAVYALAGVVLGAVTTGLAAAGAADPVALTVSLAVYAYLGGPVGVIASANTPATEQGVIVDDAGGHREPGRYADTSSPVDAE